MTPKTQPITMTNEQDPKVLKAKQDVANMKAAKESMMGVLVRIEALENLAKKLDSDLERFAKHQGENVYAEWFVKDKWEKLPLRSIVHQMRGEISKVL